MNPSPTAFPAALLLCLLSLAGCSNNNAANSAASGTASSPAAAGSAASAPAMPPVAVTSARAVQRDFPVMLVANGTVTPTTSVDVRAQTSSTIVQVHFKEGDFVRSGQLLFTLDARNDQANLAKAQAQLQKDQASLADAKRQLERARQLLAQNFVSQGAVDTALAQVESQTASCSADQAAIDAAKVALSNNRVVAPGSGRAGQVSVAAGSTVQANLTSLVTLVQLDPIDVAFNIPQRNLPDALQALKGGGAAVSAQLPDSKEEYLGKLRFVDNLVDANTGTVKAKASFANHSGKLWPGAFVQVRQTIARLKNAVVIPEAAIIQGLRGSQVYVIVDGRAAARPVQVQYSEAGQAAVSGVKAGEAVVLDGKQNVRNNAPVIDKSAAKG